MKSMYVVEIKETLSTMCQVLAESEEDAIAIVKKEYANEEVVLGPEDHCDTEFLIVEDESV